MPPTYNQRKAHRRVEKMAIVAPQRPPIRNPQHDPQNVFGGGCHKLFDKTLLFKNIIGKGAFGTVFETLCLETNNKYAVKVRLLRNARDLKTAKLESAVIRKIASSMEFNKFVVTTYGIYEYCGFMCSVMELLKVPLGEYHKKHGTRQMPVTFVRNIGRQLLDACRFIHNCGIIHTDLKPDNIMINHGYSGYDVRIRVIDFGCAIFIKEAHCLVGCEFQSLQYRAPEIMFGLPFSEKMDLWSVGIILAELYAGVIIMPGRTTHQMAAILMELIGTPLNLEKGLKTSRYFNVSRNRFGTTSLQLKTPYEMMMMGYRLDLNDYREHRMSHISQITEYGYNQQVMGQLEFEDECWAAFLQGLLDVNSSWRFSCADALNHMFLAEHESSLLPPLFFGPSAVLHQPIF